MKTYELLLSDESDEIMAISLVKDPAIMANWVYFNKDEVKFATVNEEKRIIVSPVLIPDIRIPRIDGQGNEYSVFFKAPTIEKLAQKFLAKGYQHKATLEHSKNIDGDVTVVESWVSASREKDKSALYFERKFPAGTWFIAWKVNSDDLWNNYVKTGKVLGASIEGLLEHKLVSMSIDQDTIISDLEEQDAIEMLGMIKGILKKDNRYKAKKKIEMESYSDYPDSVSNNAKRGIELNDKLGNKCATPVGKIRAQQLANKRPLSVETISRMYSYLSRAEAYYDENDMNACGTISFYLWGGLAGKRWAESKLKELGKLEMSAVDLETSVSVASTYAGDFETGSVDMEIQAPNVNVFGYHTRYFHMCPGAQSLFQHMITMPVDEDTIGMIRSAAQVADNVFRKEEEVIKAGVASQHDYEEVVLLVDDFKDIMHEIDEEVGMQHDVSFMDGHVIKVKEYLPIEMAEVGPRGGIKESPKAPKSGTPNPEPKGEGSAKGDASGKRGAKVTAEQEKTLEGKVKDFNERESNTKNGNATLGALKSVFQRGLGAYNTSHSPNVQSAEQWAYARVNAFLYLLKNGRPENPKYTTDYDLLPKGHPKAS